MKINSNFYISTVELTWRIFTAIYMFRYAMVKFNGSQFAYGKTLYRKTIDELSGLDLTWVFFGYSESFTYVIGFLQVFGGALLLFNKTKILGVAILFPILLNILLIDIFYAGYPILEAIINVSFYIFVLLFVCFNERLLLANTLYLLLSTKKKSINLKTGLLQIVLVMSGIALTYVFINFILKKLLLGIHFQSEIFH